MTTLTLGALAAALNEFAPTPLAYDWDNVGLQTGDPSATVRKVLVGLELSPTMLDAAIAQKCQAVITHHPLIFRPLKALRADNPSAALIMELVRSNIGLIAAHTNLDRVMHGTGGAMASLLGLRDWEILEPVSITRQYKFVVFVPREFTPKIIEAVHRGGGGGTGAYSHCSFRSPGTGTFTPLPGAHPFIGSVGKMEEVDEDRLETLVPEHALARVLAEVRQAHPYEEVAFDVVPLHEADPAHGLGLLATLPTKTPLRQFAQQVRQSLNEPFIQFAGDAAWPVKRVAIVTGSAGSAAYMVRKDQADLIITGEMNYHTVQDITAKGIGVICTGHAASERIFAPYFCQQFAAQKAIEQSRVELVPFTDFPEPWRIVQPAPKATSSKRKSK